MTATTALQFSPVPAYFCSGWVKLPIYLYLERSYQNTKKFKQEVKIIEFHKHQSFRCKMTLTFYNQILMYFHIFTVFHLQSLQEWIITKYKEYFVKFIPKSPNIVNKRTFVPGYRLLSCPSKKQIDFASFLQSPYRR